MPSDALPSWRSRWHPEDREVDLGVDGSQRVDAVPESAYLRADRDGFPLVFGGLERARSGLNDRQRTGKVAEDLV